MESYISQQSLSDTFKSEYAQQSAYNHIEQFKCCSSFDDKVDVVVDQLAQSLHDAKALLELHGFKVTV
jgi:hypothetical protein